MRLAVLQHEPETGLGRFGELLADSGAECEIVSTRRRLPDPLVFDAALCLGGSLAATDPSLLATRRWIRNAVLRELPYLGVCLGGQLLASALGARVVSGGAETGIHSVFLTGAAQHDRLFGELPRRLDVFSWHGDSFELPRDAVPLAGSLACTYQAFRYGAAAYALQFHPEVGPEDVARWLEVPAYRQLLDESEREWKDVVDELARATLVLDELAAHLLQRWLCLVDDVAACGATLPVPGWDDDDRNGLRRWRTGAQRRWPRGRRGATVHASPGIGGSNPTPAFEEPRKRGFSMVHPSQQSGGRFGT